MQKPILAILTHSIRMDNHLPLKYFQRFKVVHFYHDAPYGDLAPADLINAVQWTDFKDLEAKLIKLNPDLIQGAEPYASRMALKMSLLTMKVAQKIHQPYFFPTFENRPAQERFGPIIAIYMKNVLKKYAAGAVRVYYMNEGAKRNLLAAGAEPAKLKKDVYGFWGVDVKLFRASYSNPLKKYILFVGRLIEDKGMTYLLAAWNSIKTKYPEVELVLIGQGPMADDFTGSQIKKMGQMKNADLPPYFANALFTVYPSVTMKRWEEQVGTVNLQSLACGRPVLTTSSGAIPEYVTEEVGVLVPERDAAALATAMTRLLQDGDFREKLAQKARPYILENFDAEKNVNRIDQDLLELVKEKDE